MGAWEGRERVNSGWRRAQGEGGGGIINQVTRSKPIYIYLHAGQALSKYTQYKDRALAGSQHSATIHSTTITTLYQAL